MYQEEIHFFQCFKLGAAVTNHHLFAQKSFLTLFLTLFGGNR